MGWAGLRGRMGVVERVGNNGVRRGWVMEWVGEWVTAWGGLRERIKGVGKVRE